jgi:hypothetical protein
MALYGAYEDAPPTPGAPRPAYGHSQDGRDDLTQVLLRLGVSGDGEVPLRLGVRDGHCSDRGAIPRAIAECLALGLEGVRGSVADSYCDLCHESYDSDNLMTCRSCNRDFCYQCGDSGNAMCQRCLDTQRSARATFRLSSHLSRVPTRQRYTAKGCDCPYKR